MFSWRYSWAWPNFPACQSPQDAALQKRFPKLRSRRRRLMSTMLPMIYLGATVSLQTSAHRKSWFDWTLAFDLKKQVYMNMYWLNTLQSWPFNSQIIQFFNLNFHPLEVVSRWRDPQHQVSENYSHLTILEVNYFQIFLIDFDVLFSTCLKAAMC